MYNHNDGFTLKKLSHDHLSKLALLKEESWWGTHGTYFLNLKDQTKWFDSLDDKNMAFAAYNRSQAMSGVVVVNNIDWIGRTASISGSMLKESRGGGCSKDMFACGVDFAFEMLNLHRLNAEVLVSNLAGYSIEVAHIKFSIEGRKRQAVFKCGRYYDSIVLGLLREDWEKHDRVLKLKKRTGSCNSTFSAEKASDQSSKVNQNILKRDIQF